MSGAIPDAAAHDVDTVDPAEALRLAARNAWSGNRVADAFSLAWDAYGLERSRRNKRLLVDLLRRQASGLASERAGDFLALLTDPEVEPNLIASAGWKLALRNYGLVGSAARSDAERLCAAFETDRLVLTLLREAPVAPAQAEVQLTRLRRWLLLARQWTQFPVLAEALTIQAMLNGGAWPFNDEERRQLDNPADASLRLAYLPNSSVRPGTPDATDSITRAVAAQYEEWPYPAWTRITRGEPATLSEAVIKSDPDLAAALPADGRILIAGCGTGRQVASVALRFPDAAVTAIDISTASLNYARRKCAEYKICNVTFRHLDLHAVAELGQRFNAIYCSGVLHHLPNPERVWRLLLDVLEPNGFMDIMVYSSAAKLRVFGARQLFFPDLLGRPVSDDVIRQARGRILDRLDHPLAAYVARSRDFTTLAGAHDLLLHAHEDPFDLKRIERTLDQLGLRVLELEIASPIQAAAYEATFPHDRAHRDIASLMRFELNLKNGLFGNYRFICCRRASG